MADQEVAVAVRVVDLAARVAVEVVLTVPVVDLAARVDPGVVVEAQADAAEDRGLPVVVVAKGEFPGCWPCCP